MLRIMGSIVWNINHRMGFMDLYNTVPIGHCRGRGVVEYLLTDCSKHFFLLEPREQMTAHLLHTETDCWEERPPETARLLRGQTTGDTWGRAAQTAVTASAPLLQGDQSILSPSTSCCWISGDILWRDWGHLSTARVHRCTTGTGERALPIVHTASRDWVTGDRTLSILYWYCTCTVPLLHLYRTFIAYWFSKTVIKCTNAS